jgi:hypothetical protein
MPRKEKFTWEGVAWIQRKTIARIAKEHSDTTEIIPLFM